MFDNIWCSCASGERNGVCEDERLKARLRQLDRNKRLDIQRGDQIGILRERLKMRIIRKPLEISAKTNHGYTDHPAKFKRAICRLIERG